MSGDTSIVPAREHRKRPLRWLARAAWRDGWVAAWLLLTGINLLASGFGLRAEWLAGTFFGATIGMAAGYFVTLQRNYRRTKREDLEFQLARVKDMELRTIARGNPVLGNDGALDHIRKSREQIEAALKVLS